MGSQGVFLVLVMGASFGVATFFAGLILVRFVTALNGLPFDGWCYFWDWVWVGTGGFLVWREYWGRGEG